MDEETKARLATLFQRQARRRSAPAVLKAWEDVGVAAVCLSDEKCEEVTTWLRVHWTDPHLRVPGFEDHLSSIASGGDLTIVMALWHWDASVAVIVPSAGLVRIGHRLGVIYPDGFLAADQHLESGLLVDIDDHEGIGIALIHPGS
jgi:hypothetical protein